jgi:hypothetical protein
MYLLDATIAFALSIAGFATVVTVIVEIIHKIFGLRARGLRVMLSQHFDDIIKPALDKTLKQAKKSAGSVATDIETLRDDLIDKMMGSPLRRQQLEQVRSAASGRKLSHLPQRILNAMFEYNEVSADDYLQRLPDTKAFEQLKQLGAKELSQFVESFDRRYGEYEKAISNFFKRRAQLLSIIVGVFLAVGANIHGLRLFERYIDNPELTARIIAQTDEIGSAIKTTRESIATQPDTDQEDLQTIESELQRANDLMGKLASTGLPFGWGFYPGCPISRSEEEVIQYDHDCDGVTVPQKEKTTKVDSIPERIVNTVKLDPLGFLQWLFVVIVTGMMIGLGGPFWFDVARRLAGIRQISPGRDSKGDTEQTPAPGARRAELIKDLTEQAKS